MKILFVVPSYKPAYIYGGPIVVIAMLAEWLVRLGHEVTVYTTTANGKTELAVPAGVPTDVAGVSVTYFQRRTGDHTHIAPSLWRQLNATVKEFEVVHIHSWWSPLVLGAAWICRRQGARYVLSPHGMFSDYILETNNSGKKRWLHRLIGKRLLEKSLLHVSTEMEWRESRKIIADWQGRIIPNPVQLSGQNYIHEKTPVFTIGFLSRLDPKKGLDVLIEALGQVKFPFRLLVAGSGEPDYTESLKKLAADRGIADSVEWVGWKSGEDKFAFLAELDLFALTSHSENFAIVVIESLSVGTPVLVSENVGLCTYVARNDYGWVTTMQPQDIARQLTKAVADKQKRHVVRTQAPALISHEYGEEALIEDYIELYTMALDKDRVFTSN